MSIPAPPTFATETNYPAGSQPWSATPIKVAPASDYFTPDTKPPAQNFNYTLNAICAQLDALNDAAVYTGISNYGATQNGITGGGASDVQGFAWDSFYQRWVVDPGSGASGNVTVSYDGGNTWVNWGTVETMSHSGPFAISPLDGSIITAGPGGGGGTVVHFPGSTGVGTNTNTSWTNSDTQGKGAATYFLGGITYVWHVFTFDQSGANQTSHWSISPDGTTWTDNTSALPSGFGGTTENVVGNYVVSVSPTIMVAGITGANGFGTDRALLLVSTDGATATGVTPSFLTGSHWQICGLHYSSNDQLFGLMVNDGTNSYFYTTPTPGTSSSWLLVKTFSNRLCRGLNTIGRVWITTGLTSTIGIPPGVASTVALASNNVASLGASATWSVVPFSLAAGSATNPAAMIRSSGQQLMFWNDTYNRSSLTVGQNPPTTAGY
jgi:hypothetical protein